MGVYVFQSLHAPWAKIGHHRITARRPNVYYRVAGRGFVSCVHPAALTRLGIEDLRLVRWYPTLSQKDEKQMHRRHKGARCGEWYPAEMLDGLLAELDALGDSDEVPEAARRQACEWAAKKRPKLP